MESNSTLTCTTERRRLRKLGVSLRRFHERLLVLHNPEENFASILPSTLRSHLEPEYRKAAAAIKCAAERADGGCEICTHWLSSTSGVRKEIERLLDEPVQKPAEPRMPPPVWKYRRAGHPQRRSGSL